MRKHLHIILTLAVIAAALFAWQQGCGSHYPLEGKAAPPFTLPLLEGGEVSLAEHKGEEVVVLDFWASWCGPCRVGMPIVDAVAAQFAGEPAAFYAVNLRESAAQVRTFLEDKGIEHLGIALDETGNVAQQYGVTSIPTTLVIDKQGVVRDSHIGYSGSLKSALAASVRELVDKKEQ